MTIEGCMSQEEYFNKVLKGKATSHKSVDIKLPEPYNRIVKGQKEADLLKLMTDILKAKGIWHKRIQIQGQIRHTGNGAVLTPSSMTGMPDIIGLIEGKMFAIEMKKSGGHITRQQLNTLKDIKLHGGIALIVVNPNKVFTKVDFSEYVTELEGIKVV